MSYLEDQSKTSKQAAFVGVRKTKVGASHNLCPF